MKPTTNIEVSVQPTAAAVQNWLVIGDDNSVSFAKDAGKNIDAEGLSVWIATRANESASAGLQACNGLRLARNMSPVKIEGKSRKAFDYVLERVRMQCRSKSAFDNILQLLPAADIVANAGGSINSNAWAVKEAMSFLTKTKALKDSSSGPVLLASKAGTVGKALVEGTGANAIRPVLKAAKAARPNLFPPKKTGTTTKKVADKLTGKDSVAKVILDLTLIVGRADKLAGAGKPLRAELAKAECLAALAKLAGFDLVAIK
jgi:hypothetical protein